MVEIRTERLLLRPFREDDIPRYAAIRRTPGLTRFLGSHTDDPEEATVRATATARAFAALWQDPGYGPWAVVRNDELIGHAGLRWVEEKRATEVLWLLAPTAQGQGYATEAARAALAYGFDTLTLDRIVAWAMPGNTPSLAIMERIGMQRFPGLVTVFGIDAVQYEIRREARLSS